MIPAFGENYRFQWEDLGDIELGRPNLGLQLPVLVYRLAQYTLREAIAQRYGDGAAGDILREAGWIAGREFCLHILNRSQPLTAFIAQLQTQLRYQDKLQRKVQARRTTLGITRAAPPALSSDST